MARTIITSVHREILKLVRSFNGLYGPLAIEAAMEALSRFPRPEWSPIVNHLDALEARGFVRGDESEERIRFYLTTEGEQVLGG